MSWAALADSRARRPAEALLANPKLSTNGLRGDQRRCPRSRLRDRFGCRWSISGLPVKRQLTVAASSSQAPKNDYLFNGSAVEYFTCFMLMFDFTLPTPGIFVRKFI